MTITQFATLQQQQFIWPQFWSKHVIYYLKLPSTDFYLGCWSIGLLLSTRIF